MDGMSASAAVFESLAASPAHASAAPAAPEAPKDCGLHRIASLEATARAPLHALLGGIQMMRMEGGLSARQTARLDGLMAAGNCLLGAIFSVLDRSPDDAEQFIAEIETAALGRRRLKVLVADDVAMNREIAAAFLRKAGHEVCLVENGADAFVACSADSFDVVLLDVRMPGLDGLATTRRIRGLPGRRGQTPIVAMTALALDDEVEDCRKAGMNGHLAKPFRPDTLNDAVTRAAATRLADTGAQVPGSFGQTGLARAPLPGFQLRMLSEERDRLRSADKAGPAAAWIDIASPWHRKAAGAPSAAKPGSAGQYTLRLRDVGMRNGQRRLVGPTLTCAPPLDRDQHEFHWLLFLDGSSGAAGSSYTGNCDLWRWARSGWYSISAPGAAFGPEDMFEQGWRYCGPCLDQKARVEIA